jgi:hypothetical protein
MPCGDAPLAQLSAPFLAALAQWPGNGSDKTAREPLQLGSVHVGVGYLAELNYYSVWSLDDVRCSRGGDAFHAEEHCRLF